ncbi:ABC transporter permease subunit [Paenibacillus durus]|uniref:Permease n=1 Tax=Paenibacillus durus TaxID=44251 RepID=A0A089HNR5_PAEDU|nr:ABC transporter permease subunit [Paenibacillus durus]AIQ12003.1 permease [Paenibacillus durus]
MNFPLYKQMMKVNAKGIMNYAFGSAFYILLIFWLYPGIAKNTQALNDLVKSMPEGVNNAFGLNSGFASAEAFVSGEYYGLILVLILAIVCVQMSTRLMAGMVDQGSMAYLLSTPTTRAKVSATQALVLVTALIVIIGVTTLAGFLGDAWFLDASFPFNSGRFLHLNIVAFMLFFAIGGLTFLVSCLSNDEKRALGISGAIAFGFFTIDLVAKISDKLSWMKALTLFSLYRPSEIVTGQAKWGQISLVLLAVGLLAFALGILLFKRRDLPL